MDDLKFYGKLEIKIQSLTRIGRIFSADDLEKRATLAINQGKVTHSNETEMLNSQTIRSHQDETYKYLGTLQLGNIKLN